MEEIIIDYKKCPCYIDRPLYRYDKGCLIQSQVFTEQQTKEKPILRCDEIINCPIKENYKQLKRLEQENEKLKEEIQAYNDVYSNHDLLQERDKYKHALEEIKEIVLDIIKDNGRHNLSYYSSPLTIERIISEVENER